MKGACDCLPTGGILFYRSRCKFPNSGNFPFLRKKPASHGLTNEVWLYAVTRQSPFLSPFQPNAAVGPPSARPPLKTTWCQLEWKLILETAALMLF